MLCMQVVHMHVFFLRVCERESVCAYVCVRVCMCICVCMHACMLDTYVRMCARTEVRTNEYAHYKHPQIPTCMHAYANLQT
jgi:hypothetical protein